jgi:CheY-like chemotaxis protein
MVSKIKQQEAIRVLVADDSAVARALLSRTLRDFGLEPVLAADGDEAWRILQGPDAPQIALLDWVMPGISGLDLCGRIRRRPDSTPYTYVILVTAKTTKEEMMTGMLAGADDYVVKPFQQFELIYRLRTANRILLAMSQSVPPMPSAEFYSCFVSYASVDDEIATRIHRDLMRAGIKSFFAPEDLRIGDEIRPKINEKIRVHDKLLLILSEASINSDWVKAEVEVALQREHDRAQERPEFQGNTTILFPIKIDDAVDGASGGWPAHVQRTRHVGDFRGWRKKSLYAKAFSRLLKDLRASDERDRLAEERRRALIAYA